MLPQINTRRRWAMIVVNVVTALLAFCPTSPAAANAPRQAPRIDWVQARSAVRVADDWLRRTKVAEKVEPVRASGIAGVRVTLRWHGLWMGAGEQVLDEAVADHTRVTDLMPLMQQAVRDALADAQETIDAQNREAAGTGISYTLEKLAPLFSLDVQIAVAPQPVFMTHKDGQFDVYHRYAPGYHGLVLGDDAGNTAWTWPADVLAYNTMPDKQFARMLRQLGYKLTDVVRVGRRGGPKLWRFDSIHLIRYPGEEDIVQLVRGNELPGVGAGGQPSPIDGRTLERMAQRLTAHLQERIDKDGKLAGTFSPSRDRYIADEAPDEDAALVVYALGLRLASLPKEDEAAAALGKDLNRLVTALTQKAMRDREGLSQTAMALLALAMVDSPLLQARKVERDLMVRRILQTQDSTGLFRESKDDYAPYPAQALIAVALAAVYEQTRDDKLGNAVASAREALWERAGKLCSDTSAPWLHMLEMRLSRAAAADESTAKSRREILSKQLADARERLILSPPKVGPPDVIGGLVVHKTDENNAPSPTWRTAHGLLILSLAARHEGVVPEDKRVRLLIDGAYCGRFIKQLMFDKPACFYVRNRDAALGGVRARLWDNDLAVAATAMSLLAVCEFQQSVKHVSGR